MDLKNITTLFQKLQRAEKKVRLYPHLQTNILSLRQLITERLKLQITDSDLFGASQKFQQFFKTYQLRMIPAHIQQYKARQVSKILPTVITKTAQNYGYQFTIEQTPETKIQIKYLTALLRLLPEKDRKEIIQFLKNNKTESVENLAFETNLKLTGLISDSYKDEYTVDFLLKYPLALRGETEDCLEKSEQRIKTALTHIQPLLTDDFNHFAKSVCKPDTRLEKTGKRIRAQRLIMWHNREEAHINPDTLRYNVIMRPNALDSLSINQIDLILGDIKEPYPVSTQRKPLIQKTRNRENEN
ncbi:MAG: hypothetical protein IJO11_05885 [Alphaproteobacteria bacterium]|nr:hypothetical protein [Alphaproteobacteria bacterium]